MKLDKICRNANVILVVARSYGLTGLVRISLKVKVPPMVVQFPNLRQTMINGKIVLDTQK